MVPGREVGVFSRQPDSLIEESDRSIKASCQGWSVWPALKVGQTKVGQTKVEPHDLESRPDGSWSLTVRWRRGATSFNDDVTQEEVTAVNRAARYQRLFFCR